MGWHDDMENAEQERDAQEYECYMSFKDGYNKAIDDCIEYIQNYFVECEYITYSLEKLKGE